MTKFDYYIIILIILILSACSSKTNNVNKETNNNSSEEVINPEDEILDSGEMGQFIVKDSLVYAWYDELNKIETSIMNFTILKEPYKNLQDESIVDTVKMLSFKESSFIFYCAKKTEALMSAHIENREFLIGNAIQIGMTKQQLEILLTNPLENDIIKVTNDKTLIIFTFEMVNDKVVSIDYQTYMD